MKEEQTISESSGDIINRLKQENIDLINQKKEYILYNEKLNYEIKKLEEKYNLLKLRIECIKLVIREDDNNLLNKKDIKGIENKLKFIAEEIRIQNKINLFELKKKYYLTDDLEIDILKKEHDEIGEKYKYV